MSRKFVYYGTGRSGVAFLNPAIDWSLRNNTQGYNGAYIRVRRASDNEEIDVSGVNNELDVANMLAWGGGSDIRVLRIYNKGFFGAGFDLVQTSGGSQPFIVKNGDLVTVNGKVAIDFSGGNFRLGTGGAQTHQIGILDNNSVLSTVFESQATGGSTGFEDLQGVIQEGMSNTSTRIVIFSDTRSVAFIHTNYSPTSSQALSFPNQQPTSTQRQFSYKREGNLVEAYAENQFVDSLSTTAQFPEGNKAFNLGLQRTGNFFFNGKWQETLIDTDQTKRELIDTNQINFYGV